MAKRRRGRGAATEPVDDAPLDVVRIGQGVGTFETVNGMPQGIVAAGLAVIAVILLRPIVRAVRAFLRG